MQTTAQDTRVRLNEKSQGMSHAAKSVFVFGFYLIGMGLTLIAMPTMFLATLGFPTTHDVWIRVVGMLALLLAFYYIQAARLDLVEFFKLTIPTRTSVIVFFISFVALGYVQPTLILLGVADLLGAIWTIVALRRSQDR